MLLAISSPGKAGGISLRLINMFCRFLVTKKTQITNYELSINDTWWDSANDHGYSWIFLPDPFVVPSFHRTMKRGVALEPLECFAHVLLCHQTGPETCTASHRSVFSQQNIDCCSKKCFFDGEFEHCCAMFCLSWSSTVSAHGLRKDVICPLTSRMANFFLNINSKLLLGGHMLLDSPWHCRSTLWWSHNWKLLPLHGTESLPIQSLLMT